MTRPRFRLAVALAGTAAAVTVAGALGAAGAGTPAAPKHVIGVRVVGGSGELFDRRTGRAFVPRGANYVRLAPEEDLHLSLGTRGPGASTALLRMRALGYNTVRVFVGGSCTGCGGEGGAPRISRAYARNLTDFLRRAKKSGQFVILTTQWLPDGYQGKIGDSPLVDDVNRIFLTDGGIGAYASFWRDLVLELRRQGAPLDAILAYDVVNEAAFVVDKPPFTLTSGLFALRAGRATTSPTLRRESDSSATGWSPSRTGCAPRSGRSIRRRSSRRAISLPPHRTRRGPATHATCAPGP